MYVCMYTCRPVYCARIGFIVFCVFCIVCCLWRNKRWWLLQVQWGPRPNRRKSRPKAESWVGGGGWVGVLGKGAASSLPPARGTGSDVNSPNGVRGGTPTAQRFSTIFSTQNDLSWHYNIAIVDYHAASGARPPCPPPPCVHPCTVAWLIPSQLCQFEKYEGTGKQWRPYVGAGGATEAHRFRLITPVVTETKILWQWSQLHYNLRNRPGINKTLIEKTVDLNDKSFFSSQFV